METLTSFNLTSSSPAQTKRIAQKLARLLPAGQTLALEGDLGAGKTTFVAGLVAGLQNAKGVRVQSPTFALARTYPTQPPLHHVDLYRLNDAVVLEDLGIESLLDDESAIVCIEWPKHHANPLPKNTLWIVLSAQTKNNRTLQLTFAPHQAELAALVRHALLD